MNFGFASEAWDDKGDEKYVDWGIDFASVSGGVWNCSDTGIVVSFILLEHLRIKVINLVS